MGDALEYEEMRPLMAGEFVHKSRYTVLPFSHICLRGYIEQC